MMLLLAAGLTVVTAATVSNSRPSWACAYAAERLPRALILRGDDAVSAEETRAARQTLSLSEAILTRAASLALARRMGASRVVIVRCLDEGPIVIEAQSFAVDRPATGALLRVIRPPAQIAAAIDEIAEALASKPLRGDTDYRGPSESALSRAGLALAAASPLERASGLTEALDGDPSSVDLRLSAVEALITARDFDTAQRIGRAPRPGHAPPARPRPPFPSGRGPAGRRPLRRSLEPL